MKKNKLTTAVVAGIAGVAGIGNAAQYINPEGTGQVLIYPYYSVNNGLNTLYSIVNTTDDTKAVKVRFLEGENSREVLDFNIYMSPYDVWTGALVPGVYSAIGPSDAAHTGEPTGIHQTGDTTCAPFLVKGGQQFLPFEIDVDAPNNNMRRSTDGHIEVLEMATFGPATNTHAAALHSVATGVPASCATIDAFWGVGDVWTGDPEEDVTGGLFGAASMVNVDAGLTMTYDAIAIDEFWLNAVGSHTSPGSLLPNLSNGDLEATSFVDGVAVTTSWDLGIEAASSLFMRQEVYNEYAFDSVVAGKSEWVVTFPTKHQHVNFGLIPPFQNEWNGSTSCDDYSLTTWDREEQENAPGIGVISPRPPEGVAPSLCYEANVIEFIDPDGGVAGTESSILGSDNLVTVSGVTVPHATENGWARIIFNAPEHTMTDLNGDGYNGLPVTGFMVSQQTNGGAAEGLLAQYAGLFVHKGQVVSF